MITSTRPTSTFRRTLPLLCAAALLATALPALARGSWGRGRGFFAQPPDEYPYTLVDRPLLLPRETFERELLTTYLYSDEPLAPGAENDESHASVRQRLELGAGFTDFLELRGRATYSWREPEASLLDPELELGVMPLPGLVLRLGVLLPDMLDDERWGWEAGLLSRYVLRPSELDVVARTSYGQSRAAGDRVTSTLAAQVGLRLSFHPQWHTAVFAGVEKSWIEGGEPAVTEDPAARYPAYLELGFDSVKQVDIFTRLGSADLGRNPSEFGEVALGLRGRI